MTETKHTPGPWFWSHRHGLCQQAGENALGPVIGASVLDATYEYDTGTEIVVSDADAKLIAAAPDLLAALKELVGQRDAHFHTTQAWDAARAAIAKATGA